MSRRGTVGRTPRSGLGVYAGRGSSHSWLWLADLFGNVETLDERTFARGLDDLDVACVSGGDTFGLAEALGKHGAEALARFIDRGGTYLGICAGACLCLRSSREPLSWFNFTEGTIANISTRAPDPLWQNIKYSCAYGACEVFHPVRGEVVVRAAGGRSLVAPLFGGPAIQPAGEMSVLAEFGGFTRGTTFITDEATARSVYVGRAAVVEHRIGRGRLVLCSPHLEHPAYDGANGWLVRHLLGHEIPPKAESRSIRGETLALPPSALALRGAAGDLRIACSGLLPLGGWWSVGAKLYDAERIYLFADFFWRRHASVSGERRQFQLAEKTASVAREAARFRVTVKNEKPDPARLSSILDDLRELCASVSGPRLDGSERPAERASMRPRAAPETSVAGGGRREGSSA